jgi:hypothetical protein
MVDMNPRYRIALIAAFLVGACSSQARADEWTTTDTVVEGVVLAAFAADYLQTRQLVADGMEGNAILGERGERMAPEPYFAIAAFAHVVIARIAPQPYRRLLQGVTLAVQADALTANYQAGYAVRF